MPPYPVTYEADYVEQRSRLHTFFRWLTVVPVAFVMYLVLLCTLVTLPVAWVVMVATGRYSPSLYRFHSGLLRTWTRINAYAALITDAYPPFSLDEEPGYPVRVAIAPPLERYDRLLALVRLVLFIPIGIVAYLLGMVASAAALVAWVVIVVTGRQIPALQSAINMALAYETQAYGYLALLTEHWPPLDGIAMELEPRAPVPELGPPAETLAST